MEAAPWFGADVPDEPAAPLAYFRCNCGQTTIYGTPGESVVGECPTCGPLFAVTAADYEATLADIDEMTEPPA